MSRALEPIIKRKVCLVGDFAVGKTSLVRRFVHRVFDERYETTVGVRIDIKVLDYGGEHFKLIIWDIAGSNEFDSVSEKYLEGANGLMLVCDATRARTLDSALGLIAQAHRITHDVPVVGLVNKVDLVDRREIGPAVIDELNRGSVPWQETSALTGAGVESAFEKLVARMAERANG